MRKQIIRFFRYHLKVQSLHSLNNQKSGWKSASHLLFIPFHPVNANHKNCFLLPHKTEQWMGILRHLGKWNISKYLHLFMPCFSWIHGERSESPPHKNLLPVHILSLLTAPSFSPKTLNWQHILLTEIHTTTCPFSTFAPALEPQCMCTITERSSLAKLPVDKSATTSLTSYSALDSLSFLFFCLVLDQVLLI